MMSTNPVSSPKRMRGRPAEYRFAEYYAALNTLSQPGVRVNAKDLATLLNISTARAATILQNLSGNYLEDTAPLVPLYSTADDEYIRSNVSNAQSIKPIRLTNEQAKVCDKALALIGVPYNSPMYQHLKEAFFPADFGEDALTLENSNNQISPDDAGILDVLVICATSIAQTLRENDQPPTLNAPVVEFRYKGVNDDISRNRRIIPRSIHISDSEWLVEALDCDARATRTFQASRMQDCKLTKDRKSITSNASTKPSGKSLRLTCEPEAVSPALALEGAYFIKEEGGKTIIDVPYFRDGDPHYRSEWLARQILALGPSVSFDDKELKKEIKRIAKANIKQLAMAQKMATTA